MTITATCHWCRRPQPDDQLIREDAGWRCRDTCIRIHDADLNIIDAKGTILVPFADLRKAVAIP